MYNMEIQKCNIFIFKKEYFEICFLKGYFKNYKVRYFFCLYYKKTPYKIGGYCLYFDFLFVNILCI